MVEMETGSGLIWKRLVCCPGLHTIQRGHCIEFSSEPLSTISLNRKWAHVNEPHQSSGDTVHAIIFGTLSF